MKETMVLGSFVSASPYSGRRLLLTEHEVVIEGIGPVGWGHLYTLVSVDAIAWADKDTEAWARDWTDGMRSGRYTSLIPFGARPASGVRRADRSKPGRILTGALQLLAGAAIVLLGVVIALTGIGVFAFYGFFRAGTHLIRQGLMELP